MSDSREEQLNRLGFSFRRGGAHSSRTIMLDELQALLAYVGDPDATMEDYRRAIEVENCLGKRSASTRKRTYSHLVDLYSLDSSTLLFRALLFFWNRDPHGRPLLAMLCAYARDPVLRATVPFVLAHTDGTTVPRESVEEQIDEQEPGRFSSATLKSTAQNVNSTLTKTGHLAGKAKKIRTRAVATSGSVAYALLLGYLSGARGGGLFQTEYARLLDTPHDRMLDLAEDASRRGWIVLKRIADIVEVLFPALLNEEDRERIRA